MGLYLLKWVWVLLYIDWTHSLTAALDQLRVVASSTSNDPGPRSRQHQQIGQHWLNVWQKSPVVVNWPQVIFRDFSEFRAFFSGLFSFVYRLYQQYQFACKNTVWHKLLHNLLKLSKVLIIKSLSWPEFALHFDFTLHCWGSTLLYCMNGRRRVV